MTRDKKATCYHCKHCGQLFTLSDGTHCHCGHPDKSVRGDDGWGTLRMAFDRCQHFEKRGKEA